MKIGLIVGSLVASQKDPGLTGLRLQIVRPVSVHNQIGQDYVVAVDAVGAGVGDYILYAGGSSARQTVQTEGRPIDAVIMAIVDTWEVDGQVAYDRSHSSQDGGHE